MATTYTVSGNVIAQNATLRLRPVNFVRGVESARTYSDSSGNYTFTGVTPGVYTLLATLDECTVTYLPNIYSYRSPVDVVVVANNLTAINMTPIAFNANTPAPNAV